ncbi:sugar phosphate nucleotidyltransferase [Rhodoligotrophos defluvii]|uniref:phosphocholine cytidylyltransferase family protein n=1 Tax=Rhodoligotrophos defluvii TaxID=2561934 RepID=UPI001485C297|nr:phosphocholine cytidylyltransferase family protein [Rhodoligotrophos defluvii]
MKVLILGAGQGSRLLPLTEDIPKALLDIGGKRLIARQIEAFVSCGVREFVVITGYAVAKMEQALNEIAASLSVSIRTVYNPFYSVADNLASCWMARAEMDGDFIQVNGDNVFAADMVERLLSAPAHPVTVAVNHKSAYDADDMKVVLDGGRLVDVGKTLPNEHVHAEAIGFYIFRGNGGALYRQVLERLMREPASLKQWFPFAIGMLAKQVEVRTVPVSDVQWCEVDFPADLEHARRLVASW